MKSASAGLSVDAFAEPDAGSDYFGTAAHCRHLAGSIVDALSRGSPVLVTGDPAPDLPLLAEALRTAAAPRQVIETPCGPDLDHKKLFGAASTGQESTRDDASAELARDSRPASSVFVLSDADLLSDLQIKEFLEAAQTAAPEQRGPKAAVLLARPAFLDRFETPLLHIHKDGFAAHLSAQHLDRDEVEAFIRHQLPPDEQTSLFTAQRVALIAVTSDGDPATINRLARRMLEVEPGASAGGRQAKRSRPVAALDKRSGAGPRVGDHGDHGEKIAKPQAKRPRYGAALGLACVAIGAAALWLVIAASDSHQLGDLVGLVRSRISPPADSNTASAEVSPRPATALPPAVTRTGSSPVAPTTASPTNATDLDAAAERTAPASASGAAAPFTKLLQSQPSEPPAPTSPALTKPAGPRVSAVETAALVARGDAFLSAGDVTSARAFFERAADAGDSQAAMRMAVTFDAAFLDRAGLHGIPGDPEQATFWYRRARELGGAEPDRSNPETGPSGAPPTR